MEAWLPFVKEVGVPAAALFFMLYKFGGVLEEMKGTVQKIGDFQSELKLTLEKVVDRLDLMDRRLEKLEDHK